LIADPVRKFGGGANAVLNQIIGDWSISGLTPMDERIPFNVQRG
jgi:hypothetical protein